MSLSYQLFCLLATAAAYTSLADNDIPQPSDRPYLCNALTLLMSDQSSVRCHSRYQEPSNTTRRYPALLKTSTFNNIPDDQSDSCSRLQCRPRQVCKVRRGRARCTCRVPCSRAERQLRPICASNSRSYKSVCAMRRTACRNGEKNVKLTHMGRCNISAGTPPETSHGTVLWHRPTSIPSQDDPLTKMETLARSGQLDPQTLSRLFRTRIRQNVFQNGYRKLTRA